MSEGSSRWLQQVGASELLGFDRPVPRSVRVDDNHDGTYTVTYPPMTEDHVADIMQGDEPVMENVPPPCRRHALVDCCVASHLSVYRSEQGIQDCGLACGGLWAQMGLGDDLASRWPVAGEGDSC